METLKISIFTFYIWYRCTATHTTKLNYRGLKTQHFSLHAIFYTYTYCTACSESFSLSLTLPPFLCASDASHFSKLIRFWLCVYWLFLSPAVLRIFIILFISTSFLCTRSSKLPMCSLHLNEANVWIFHVWCWNIRYHSIFVGIYRKCSKLIDFRFISLFSPANPHKFHAGCKQKDELRVHLQSLFANLKPPGFYWIVLVLIFCRFSIFSV